MTSSSTLKATKKFECRSLLAAAFNSVTLNITLREKENPIIIKPDKGASDDIVDVLELGRKYPKKAVQDYEKARDELHKGNDVKAVELLVGVVKLAPDLYGAHNTLGTLYQKDGKFREAEVEYRRARELNPRVPEPLVNLGSLLIDEAAARAKEGAEVVGKILDDALDTLEESLKVKRSPNGLLLPGGRVLQVKLQRGSGNEFEAGFGNGSTSCGRTFNAGQRLHEAAEVDFGARTTGRVP